jgi:hypothetical protein
MTAQVGDDLGESERRGARRRSAPSEQRGPAGFFACEEDLSHELPDAPLPEAVATGPEPFVVVGAMAGG